MSEERQIFTLKQVTNSIQKVINERYPKVYWIQTEIHKLNYTSKGHCYPELVHKENGQVLAEMRGTIWATNFEKINKNFAQVVKEPIRDGMSLLLCVKIVFHSIFGISLEIIDIDPTYSLGELQKERDETLKKLTAEGVLNNNQKLPFPLLPKRIAIISQDGIKGLQDFYTIINKNPWNYSWFFMLFPAQLNGDLAINSIVQQLERIEKVKNHFDAVLIIRGGGGEIGLSCYNNYQLARKIATFPLPIMTGIGHSTNITVSELVAYRNAITPTELADFLIQAFHEFSVPLQNALKTIKKQSLNLLANWKNELKNEIKFLNGASNLFLIEAKNSLKNEMNEIKLSSKNALQSESLRFNKISFQVNEKIKIRINESRYLLKDLRLNLKNASKVNIQSNKLELDSNKKKLNPLIERKIKLENSKIELLENTIRLVDPINVLKRGYSISLKNGKIISTSNPIFEGDLIEVKTSEFEFESEIKKIK
jgi:exodeoxyribonuclease VII large subunit